MKTKFAPNHPVLIAVLTLLVSSVSAIAQNQTTAKPESAESSGRAFARSWHISLPRPIMVAAWERLKKLDIPGVSLDQRFNIHDLGQTAHDHAIYLSADDVTVRRNFLFNTAGRGIHAYTEPKRLMISHNLMGGNAQDAVVLGGSD